MSPLEVYLVTFNCGRCLVDPAAFAAGFFDALPSQTSLPDIIAVSLQEIAPIAHSFLGGSYLQPYFNQIDAAVNLAVHKQGNGSRMFEAVFTGNNGMTALVVFAAHNVASRISTVSSASTGVGLWNMGNKGAVGAKISVDGDKVGSAVDLLFIAAHLAPMETAWERRNHDWETIVRTLVFDGDADSNPQDTVQSDSESDTRPLVADRSSKHGVYHPGSYVFVCGDLNYRTSDNPPGEDAYLAYPQPADEDSPLHYSHLLKKDQLNREMKAGRTLQGFEEMPITFPPTYKIGHRLVTKESSTSHAAGEKSWNWARHRFPAWCDRCLVLVPSRETPPTQPHEYTSLRPQLTSDHQPVALFLTIPETAWNAREHHGFSEDSQQTAPFPIDRQWHARQQAARQKEFIVGVLAYLSTTTEGLTATFIGVTSIAILTWIITLSI